MSQSVKIYGLIFLACICLMLFLDSNHKLITDDALFESVRTTQMSVLDEGLNKGDLIVNSRLSVDPQRIMRLWEEKFQANKSTRIPTEIRFVDIHTEPAGIAVSVCEQSRSSQGARLTSVYDNVIIADWTEEES